MNFKYIHPDAQVEWESLVTSNPASGYMQSFFWAEFKNTLGWTTFKIGMFEEEKIVGGAIVAKFPYSTHKNILYIPEGPVISYDAPHAEEMFQSFMAEIDTIADLTGPQLTSHLRIEPKLTQLPSFFNRFQKAPINQQPLSTQVIDLILSEEQLMAAMKPKGRYNVKIAKQHGVRITQTSPQSGMKDFLRLYLQTVERNKFEGKDADYFERLAYALSLTDTARVFFATYNGKILASAIVLGFGKIATFLFGASSSEQRELMAPYLLHWEIIRFAQAKGYREYDFYGVSPDETDHTHPWQGITAFKKKFGGRQINYIGAYDFVYNQKLYEEYLKESGEII